MFSKKIALRPPGQLSCRTVLGQALLTEEFLPGPGGWLAGANHIDITAIKNGRVLRINAVTTIDGVNPTASEFLAASQIRAKLVPGEHLLLIPKPS